MNAALDRPVADAIPHVLFPSQWQAGTTTPNNAGGRRYAYAPQNEMMPVGGVDWRTCAIYCNWLHNGKSLDRSAFLSGAYDVSTFGRSPGGVTYTDQVARSPGARYFVPSLDEWIKAAHWDPNKPNADGTTGDYWLYSNSSDTPYAYGPPGVRVRPLGGLPGPDPNGELATANAGWNEFHFDASPYAIPLGAYEGVTSPWGLMDVAGGTSEWLEEVLQSPREMYFRSRFVEGSAMVFATNGLEDQVRYTRGNGQPDLPFFEVGFRVAAVVPSPGWCALGGVAMVVRLSRRRR